MSKKFIKFFDKLSTNCMKGLVSFSKLSEKKEGKDILNFSIKLIIAILLILLMKIPTDILVALTEGLLHSLPTVLNPYLVPLMSVLIHLLYFIFSFLFLYYIFKETPKRKLDAYQKLVVPKFLNFIKTILVILNIPLILGVVILTLIFAILVAFLFAGVYFVSLFLLVISLISLILTTSILIRQTIAK